MRNNKLAVIDLGTNTFHILIVTYNDSGFQKIFSEKIPVKIGEKGISHGIIHEQAVEKIMDTFQYFKSVLEQHAIPGHQVKAVATSAFRNAKNGIAVAQEILNRTAIQIEIIDGGKEASLIYEGVRNALEIGDEKSLVIDIGGGSVEFIICTGKEVYWQSSFEIGGQRLLDRFMAGDKITEKELQAMNLFLEQQLIELHKAIELYQPQLLIGSSGSFETLAEMKHLRYGIPFNLQSESTEYMISKEDFDFIYKEIISSTREKRLKMQGLLPMRVDMIVVALELIYYLTEKYKFKIIRISTYALKEGLMFDLLGR